ncbi:hypothetical protein LCGC14_2783680, partial [marine sediment metagenome]
MALGATMVFECRASATANNVNGGGYTSGGTDYSQQDAAVTDFSKTDGTSNASTTFTSAAATFTAQAVGNVLHLISGTNGTPGWYEIATYVSANEITLDRNCSTGAMTDGVFNVGGAMSLNSAVANQTDDDFFEIMLAGHKIWIENGSYTLGVTVSIAADGSETSPIVIEGYNATRGDAPTGSTRPTMVGGANNWSWTGDYWDIFNLIITGTGTVNFNRSGHSSKTVNCKGINTSST